MDYGELGYLLNQRRAGMGNQGAAELGALLGGGMGQNSARYQQIFNQSALTGARMQDTLAQAKQRQQQGIEFDRQQAARRNLENRARSAGNADLADMFAGYSNPDQIAQARLGLLKAKAMQQALDLANNPTVDYNHLNAIKMATAADPTQLVRNMGDGSYTTNAYRTDQPVALSDIGRAFVAEKAAQAGAANAAATEHYAQAGAAKALQDQRTGKGAGGVAGKPRPFTNAEVVAAAGGGDGSKIDPDRFVRFSAYRKSAGNDTDALLQMHDDDVAAQSGMGPPSDLAPPKPGFLSSLGALFGGGNSTAPAQPSAKIATPQTQADFDALPSGATYVNPADGKTYRKK